MSSSATGTAAAISFAGPTSYITTPLAIPGCAMWLDAADSATVITSGSNVTQWNDKSGNGYNVGSNSNYFTTTLPTYSSNTTNKYVQMAPNQALCSALYNYTTAWSVFVCMNNVIVGERFMVSPYVTVNLVMMSMNLGNNKIWQNAFTTTPTDIIGNHIEYTSAENTNALSNLLYYRDGVIQASNVKNMGVAANASAKMGIGANATLNNAMAGTYQVYEIVIYNRYLTTVQRQQVEGYLGWKWGLQTNLARSHPYANSFNNPGYFGNLGTSIIQSVPFSNTLPVTTGLALWLDAADSATIQFSSGANVSNWRDKSGNGRNATPFTGTGFGSITFTNPIYSVNSVIFNGSNFFTTTLTSLLSNQSGFAIVSFNSTAKINILSLTRTGVSAPAGLQQVIQNNQQLITTYGGTTIVTGATLPQNTILMYEHTFSATTNAFMYYNGTQTGTTNGPYNFSNTGTVNIGAYDNGGESFRGTMYEFILYSNVLTTPQRQQVESYLAWKWGIQTNLPTTHPYYNNATFANLPPITRTTAVLNAGFTPTSLSGLALWLDAADSATVLTSNSSVTQWNDKSGSNNNASNAVSANQPLYVTSPSGNYISFNAALSQFLGFTNPNALVANTTFTVMFVEKRQSSTANYILGGSATLNTNLHTGYQSQTNIRFGFYGNDLDFSPFSSYNTSNEPSRLWVFDYNGSTRSIILNSSILVTSSNSTNLTAWTNGSIGNFRSSAYYTGNLYEMLIYRPSLSTTQRQQIEGYLAWKWSLTGSLPASHPNKYMPP